MVWFTATKKNYKKYKAFMKRKNADEKRRAKLFHRKAKTRKIKKYSQWKKFFPK